VMEKNQREEENILKKKDQTSKYKIWIISNYVRNTKI
jgi:hypothetical protein